MRGAGRAYAAARTAADDSDEARLLAFTGRDPRWR